MREKLYIFSSHLGLIRCLTPVRVSAIIYFQAFLDKSYINNLYHPHSAIMTSPTGGAILEMGSHRLARPYRVTAFSEVLHASKESLPQLRGVLRAPAGNACSQVLAPCRAAAFECLMRYGVATVAQTGLDISRCWKISRCCFLDTSVCSRAFCPQQRQFPSSLPAARFDLSNPLALCAYSAEMAQIACILASGALRARPLIWPCP